MDIATELQALIEKWMRAGRNNSIARLARISGVSYPTVRRIHQKEGETTLNNVVNILSFVATPDEARSFIARHFPILGKMIEPSLLDPVPLDAAELEDFTAHDFLVLGLAATKQGVSEQEVRERAGDFGMTALRKLEGAGVVQQMQPGRYKSKSQMLRYVGSKRVLELVTYLCGMFDHERTDSRGSLFRVKTEGLTKAAVIQIYKILYEASEKVQEVMENPDNHGNYVLGVGMVSTFLSFPKGEANL